jgi:hypothetical protein
MRDAMENISKDKRFIIKLEIVLRGCSYLNHFDVTHEISCSEALNIPASICLIHENIKGRTVHCHLLTVNS